MTYECPKVRELEQANARIAELEAQLSYKTTEAALASEKPVVWLRECEDRPQYFYRCWENGNLRFSQIEFKHSWLAIYEGIATVREWTEPKPEPEPENIESTEAFCQAILNVASHGKPVRSMTIAGYTYELKERKL